MILPTIFRKRIVVQLTNNIIKLACVTITPIKTITNNSITIEHNNYPLINSKIYNPSYIHKALSDYIAEHKLSKTKVVISLPQQDCTNNSRAIAQLQALLCCSKNNVIVDITTNAQILNESGQYISNSLSTSINTVPLPQYYGYALSKTLTIGFVVCTTALLIFKKLSLANSSSEATLTATIKQINDKIAHISSKKHKTQQSFQTKKDSSCNDINTCKAHNTTHPSNLLMSLSRIIPPEVVLTNVSTTHQHKKNQSSGKKSSNKLKTRACTFMTTITGSAPTISQILCFMKKIRHEFQQLETHLIQLSQPSPSEPNKESLCSFTLHISHKNNTLYSN